MNYNQESKIEQIINYLQEEKWLNKKIPSRNQLAIKFNVVSHVATIAIYFLKGAKKISCLQGKGCWRI